MTKLAGVNFIGCKENWDDEVFLWSPTSKYKKKCLVEDYDEDWYYFTEWYMRGPDFLLDRMKDPKENILDDYSAIGETLHRRGSIELVSHNPRWDGICVQPSAAPKEMPTNNFAWLDESEINAWEWRELTKLDKLYEEIPWIIRDPEDELTDEMIDDHDDGDGWSQVKVNGILRWLE